jgi:hypothetical protein
VGADVVSPRTRRAGWPDLAVRVTQDRLLGLKFGLLRPQLDVLDLEPGELLGRRLPLARGHLRVCCSLEGDVGVVGLPGNALAERRC